MLGAPNVSDTIAMISRPSDQWRRNPLHAHRPHGPLHQQTANELCRRHMKASYNNRHDGERSRDAYDPDKDG